MQLDFKNIVREIAHGGAFKNFEKPMRDPGIRIEGEYRYPIYPGDDGLLDNESDYANSPMILQMWEQDLPQALINAQHKSVAAAISLYMPAQTITQWMHQYFSGDFLSSKSFRNTFNKTDFPKTSPWSKPLSDDLTLDFENPERKRNDRRLYTKEEIEITQRVCKQIPTLAITVIAYQAAFMEYMKNLSDAIARSDELSPQEKERGLKVLSKLKGNWLTDNFIDNILPGVAIHYYKRNEGKIGAPPTEEDFSQGMSFAYKNGMFNNGVKGPQGDMKQLSCPAKGIINKLSGKKSIAAQANNDGTDGIGTGLFHIFREIESQVARGNHSMDRAAADMVSKIDAAVRDR